MNARGTTIPCRSNGDLLLSFESGGGSSLETDASTGGPATAPARAACPNGAKRLVHVLRARSAARDFQGSMNAAAIDQLPQPGDLRRIVPGQLLRRGRDQPAGRPPGHGAEPVLRLPPDAGAHALVLVDLLGADRHDGRVPVYSSRARRRAPSTRTRTATARATPASRAGRLHLLRRPRRRRREGQPASRPALRLGRLLPDPQRPGRHLQDPRGHPGRLELHRAEPVLLQPHVRQRRATRPATTSATPPRRARRARSSTTPTATASRTRASRALAGFTFYVDYDDDGVKDAGEPSGTSDGAAPSAISGVQSGTYKIREVAQAGWTCSTPSPCYYTPHLHLELVATGLDVRQLGHRLDLRQPLRGPGRRRRRQGGRRAEPVRLAGLRRRQRQRQLRLRRDGHHHRRVGQLLLHRA